MNLLPECFLYTHNEELKTRVEGSLKFVANIRLIQDPNELESIMVQFDPALLCIDLRCESSRSLLIRLIGSLPNMIVLAFGRPRSTPAIEAEALGAYAVVDFDVDHQRLQSLVKHAHQHLKVIKENRLLRSDPKQESKSISSSPVGISPIPTSFQNLSKAFRHFDDAAKMLESMADAIASSARVSRVGIFAYNSDKELYTYRAGVKCFEDTCNLAVSRNDPLVRWMQLHAHVVAKGLLHVVDNPEERVMLHHSLEVMGAEVIIPLHGRSSIIGWLSIGHHITGAAFSQSDLEDLMLLGEHVAVTLENQQLYERVAVQKALADTVFDSMPVGIVAVDADCRLRWMNTAAEEILGVSAADVAKKPASSLSSQMADMLSQRINDEAASEPVEREDPRTKRSLSLMTRKLVAEGTCIGALAIVRDLTQEHRLREKEEQVERAAFWTELAAAMSHEVRNPLVAISTFAQLLPERYADPEFRDKFSELVNSEIARLNGIVDQITNFAEAPVLCFEQRRVDDIIYGAIANASDNGDKDRALIEVSIDNHLPFIECDRIALSECFAHIIRNALEAVANVQYPAVHVTASLVDSPEGGKSLSINIMDNGNGIQEDISDKLFSPFCTTKARGIGLGLPIARRTVIDHGGQLKVGSSRKGTSVEILLPVPAATSRNGENMTPLPQTESA